MGLSSKQVSSSGLDWNNTLLEAQNLELPKPNHKMKKQQLQTEQSSSESFKCPRCNSTNTKFCYYNNYNKSQPRHFCRACKRHWTKGGTLRNVPVGGGRKKNKRVKKPTTPTSSTTTTTATTSTCTNMDGVLSNNMNIQTLICPPSLLLQQNRMNSRDLEGKDFGIGIGNGMTLSSTFPLSQNQSLLFPFSTSSSFYTNPCSVSTSLRSSNVYNCEEEFKTIEDPTINSVIPSTSDTNTQTWEIPATNGGMEMSNYWSWEDIDSLVSTDLKDPWDDSTKP